MRSAFWGTRWNSGHDDEVPNGNGNTQSKTHKRQKASSPLLIEPGSKDPRQDHLQGHRRYLGHPLHGDRERVLILRRAVHRVICFTPSPTN